MRVLGVRQGGVLLAAIGLMACSKDSARRSAPAAAGPPPASRRVAACSLVTEAEVAQAVGRAVVRTTAQDTIFEPGYWSSTCTFQLAGPAPAGVVTVGTSGDYPTVADGGELADAVSAEAMGISAQPLEGFSLPAAIYPDTGILVQKGAMRLLVSGARRDAITALASSAASRLP
jgi:hypothetical protein